MEVLEASFTTTSLATEGELAANPINGRANDQTYFVKPYEDPDSRFRIEEAKILIKSIYRRRLDVNKKNSRKKVRSRRGTLKVEYPTSKRKEIEIRHGFEEETAGTFTASSRQAEFRKQRVPGSRDKFMLGCR
ncbi:hypothetical protein OIU79_024409 [Salix purpurea]|uniref:Uncharacterized protein n=1 Tax=Salix purpurea TaxID=77065 RepID=A0A9Q0WBU4_SALPP|nr:hypothetical protein OIU79_024409 [Salix purpurea]